METTILPTKKVTEVFSRATRKVLEELGSGVPDAVLFHVEKMMNVSRSEIFEDPVRFAEALDKVFSVGAPIVEEKIIQLMCIELHIDYDQTHGNFQDKIATICAKDSSKRTFKLGALEQTMHRY
ncbi:MAG: hypothetical protein ACYC7D_11495 [Nitrososphaerales archaeon]